MVAGCHSLNESLLFFKNCRMGFDSASCLLKRLVHSAKRTRNTERLARSDDTQIVIDLLDSSQFKKAVDVFFYSSTLFPSFLYVRILRECSSKRAIVEARKVESKLVASNPNPWTFLLNRIIETYADCGFLRDALELFDEMPQRDGGSWNAIIRACSESGDNEKAVSLFRKMNASGLIANEITFAYVLNSCTNLLSLCLAQQVHSFLLKNGFCTNIMLGNSLIHIYGKCQEIQQARTLFDEIPSHNSVSYNTIVRRYLEMGMEEEALIMFVQMIRERITPLNFTFSTVLTACIRISALQQSFQIHQLVIKLGFIEDNFIIRSLIDTYAIYGDLEGARRVFDDLKAKDVFVWTSMVSGYAMHMKIDDARNLFNEMPERNVVSLNVMLGGLIRSSLWDEALEFLHSMFSFTKDVDSVTLILMLKVCAMLKYLKLGKVVHGFAYRRGIYLDIVVKNAILSMYAKCGYLRSANFCFLEMGCDRDATSWNALISGYANNKQSEEALRIFSEMKWEIESDQFTFSTMFAVCANTFTIDVGKQIHGYVIRREFKMDSVIRGALVDMYCKCRHLNYAMNVFKEEFTRDVILWNSIIIGCAYNGKGVVALELFESMKIEGINADYTTFIGVLLSCIGEGYVELGYDHFKSMADEYHIIPRIEHYECMIELLGKHGYLDELEVFLLEMPFEPTEAMWMRIFDCCKEYGHSRLGQRAEQKLNELKPLNLVRFEIPA